MRRRNTVLLFNQGAATVEPWYLKGGVAAASCIAAYMAVGAASQAASYINLANPGTYNLTLIGSGLTWNTVTGWSFVPGGNARLATGWVPPNTGVRSLIIKYAGAAWAVADRYICGCNGTGYFGVRSSTSESRCLNGGSVITAALPAGGAVAVAGAAAYLDGTKIADIPGTDFNCQTYGMLIGATNAEGTHIYFFYGAIICAAFYDVALTPAQVAAIGAALP